MHNGDLIVNESSSFDSQRSKMEINRRETDLCDKFLKDQRIYEMVHEFSQEKTIEGTKRKPIGISLELLSLTKSKLQNEKARIVQKRQ